MEEHMRDEEQMRSLSVPSLSHMAKQWSSDHKNLAPEPGQQSGQEIQKCSFLLPAYCAIATDSSYSLKMRVNTMEEPKVYQDNALSVNCFVACQT